ncbi:MAG: hypothetical protein IJK81_00175 [Selenomonadaceae bacterium]|nr:hypothetical protein [Selenomonadaceae bacterium]
MKNFSKMFLWQKRGEELKIFVTLIALTGCNVTLLARFEPPTTPASIAKDIEKLL